MLDKSNNSGADNVLLPDKLLKLIDERREQLTRDEFIELCVKLTLSDKRKDLESFVASASSVRGSAIDLEENFRKILDEKVSSMSRELVSEIAKTYNAVQKIMEDSKGVLRATERVDAKLDQISQLVKSELDNIDSSPERGNEISSETASESIERTDRMRYETGLSSVETPRANLPPISFESYKNPANQKEVAGPARGYEGPTERVPRIETAVPEKPSVVSFEEAEAIKASIAKLSGDIDLKFEKMAHDLQKWIDDRIEELLDDLV